MTRERSAGNIQKPIHKTIYMPFYYFFVVIVVFVILVVIVVIVNAVTILNKSFLPEPKPARKMARAIG